MPAMIALAGPYPPGAGQPGSDAVIKTSPSISEWASGFQNLTRGPLDIANPAGGLASFGTGAQATGPADADVSSSNVVSLGDGGSITVTFAKPIANGAGPDFAVFENGFSAGVNSDFLELAFVDVSSDGTNFFRFRASSLTSTATQVASFGTIDPTNLRNLAGKYGAGYGTRFDLDELKNTSALLDVNNIRYVKITDVIGNINTALGAGTYSLDGDGNVINDPYPTAFSSGGFDMDAVGVMNVSNAPEPTGLLILAGGLPMLLMLRRRKVALPGEIQIHPCNTGVPPVPDAQPIGVPVKSGVFFPRYCCNSPRAHGLHTLHGMHTLHGRDARVTGMAFDEVPGRIRYEQMSRVQNILMFALLSLSMFAIPSFAAVVSNLEDVPLNVRGDYYNGTTAAPGPNGPANSPDFFSQGFKYQGTSSDFGDGIVASNHTDTSNHQPNFFQFQYESIAGTGAGGSATYAVASDFGGVRVDLPAGDSPLSVQLTNASYAYYTMLDGDSSFGTAPFGPGSWFKVTIAGLDGLGHAVGTPVNYYLADLRSANAADHYISNAWGTADLTPLAGASSLVFTLSSSDTDPVFGMNTPAYFAMDNLTATPEPGSVCILIAGASGLLARRRRGTARD